MASFSQAFDPSAADTVAGFSYRYDCSNDDSWEGSGHSLTSFACRYLTSGTFTVAGEIHDKDGGRTRYSAVVTVLSPQQALQSLIADVTALLAAGVLNSGQANSLISVLNGATASLDRGRPGAAVNQIQAFANLVEGLTNGGILTGGQSQLLLEKARRASDAVDVSN